MRERQITTPDIDANVGITPARAGKTKDSHYDSSMRRDHPRSCGKDLQVARKLTFSYGITPARAGKTSICTLPALSGKDHPRSCGKDHWKIYFHQLSQGSPPLVRERLHFLRAGIPFAGITPARAGKTRRNV